MFYINHFYKLCKALPENEAYIPINVCGSYGLYEYGRNIYISSQFGMPKCFTIDGIYQACGEEFLYDDRGGVVFLTSSEMECFMEVDIGLTDTMKQFLSRLSVSRKFKIQFGFSLDNTVTIKLTAYTSMGTPSDSVDGFMNNINNLIPQVYKKVRSLYSCLVFYHLFKTHQHTINSYKWCYDFETMGRTWI